jgi:hypothetical protein
MPLAALFSTAILETILIRLAALFLTGAGGDSIAARQAALQMLGAYRPETEDELRLAANIIGFGLHALEALGQASTPDLSLTRILRLRGSAVSLSREAAKAQRSLDQLQKARRQDMQAQPIQAPPAQADREALDLIKDTSDITAAAKIGRPARTETEEDRQRNKRIAAFMQRPAIQAAVQANAAMSRATPVPHDRTASQAA